MSSTTETDLFGTTWVAVPTKDDVNKLNISFNAPHACVVTFENGGKNPPTLTCDWAESFGGGHFFGLTGGSVSMVGSCSVASGTGQVQGFAAGAGLENWTLTKQS